jgi:ribosomal protein L31
MVNRNKLYEAPPDLLPFETWVIDADWVVGICRCQRCGHKWILRGGTTRKAEEMQWPKVCSKCHSAYWNTRRKLKGKAGQ